MKHSQSLVTEATLEPLSIHSLKKKKKRKTYIIVRTQDICSVIHTKVNEIQIQL